MPRSLTAIIMIVCGFIVIPPLIHKLFPPGLPIAALHVHETPRRLAEFKFYDDTGRNLTLDHFRHTFILLNVWATWCPPCKEEITSLNHLASLFATKDLRIIPISVDVSGASEVRYFYKKMGLKRLPIYIDPSQNAMHALAVSGIPTTLLINRDGLEIGRLVGAAQWDAPAIVKRIAKIVKQ
jgi:thiol-disulfide isomerase/thioredoxin